MFTKKEVDLLTALYDNNELNLSKITMSKSMTYAHALKLVNDFEEKRLINKNKIGRELRIKFTEKGILIVQLMKLYLILDGQTATSELQNLTELKNFLKVNKE